MGRHEANKALIRRVAAAQYDFDLAAATAALAAVTAPGAEFRLAHPLGDPVGAADFAGGVLGPLCAALPDLERRDTIVIAGAAPDGTEWVGCAGGYMGTFAAPWLDIPPTGHLVHLRYHEFYRVEAGRIAEVQAVWDIPSVMMQAGAWPMAPSLGREWVVPGPATQDGVTDAPRDAALSEANCGIVQDMLAHMGRHPAQGGAEVMEMPRFWHPRMTWYGPAGIGSMRGIAGFRAWHQIPFLAAMPDRGQDSTGTETHFLADGAYVGVTGWPNMRQTLTGDGWMGIAPAGRTVTLRSLDFWRLEAGLIRENWVLIDLLDVYRQLGVDVLARMRDFNKARVPGAVPFPVGG